MSFSLSLLGEILIEESSELLGNPKALIPIRGRKTETSSRMAYDDSKSKGYIKMDNQQVCIENNLYGLQRLSES